MFSKESKYQLQKVGIYMEESQLFHYRQKEPKELIQRYPLEELLRIELKETSERNRGWGDLFIGLSGSSLWQPKRPSKIYCLVVTLKSGNKKYSYLSNFDLIGLTVSLKKLNAYLKENAHGT